jgi:hypothetical protein
VTGFFEDAATFGAGERNESSLTAAGGRDVFVARYAPVNYRMLVVAPDGLAFAAAQELFGRGRSVAALPDGGTAVTGESGAGVIDVFVGRYNANGTLAWMSEPSGPLGDGGYDIDACLDGSLVVTGLFRDTLSFDVGLPSLLASGVGDNADIFLARYAGDGVVMWAKRAGGPEIDEGRAIACLTRGELLVAGVFFGAAVFGPGEEGETTLTSLPGDPVPGLNSADGFLARYDADGFLVWVKQNGSDFVEAISAFSDGTSVTTGSFFGNATFGPGEVDETTLSAVPIGTAGFTTEELYVARHRPDGSLAWAIQSIGNPDLSSAAKGFGAAAFPNGDVLIAGVFRGQVTFGLGEAGETTLESQGLRDGFVVRYNTNGSLLWARRVGGIDDDAGLGAVALPDGSAAVTGFFQGDANFGPFATVGSLGSYDAFVARYGPDGSLVGVRTVGGVGSDQGWGIDAFPNGDVAATGEFQSDAFFGIGETNETILLGPAEGTDSFVMKYFRIEQ